MSDSDAPRAGRPQLVSSSEILAEARRMVTRMGVDDFSVRELAKSLGLVPGTIHARFGNKDELLAQLYIHGIDSARQVLEDVPVTDVAGYLGTLSHHLPALRREFVMHFERDRASPAHLSAPTWTQLREAFSLLSDTVYRRFREAAAAESVTVMDGSAAERLVWTVSSTLDSVRSELAFGHSEDDYRNFVAQVLLTALADPNATQSRRQRKARPASPSESG